MNPALSAKTAARSSEQKGVVCSSGIREGKEEEGMATHSSILAWRSLWTKEPGRLQSMGLQSPTWLSNWALERL